MQYIISHPRVSREKVYVLFYILIDTAVVEIKNFFLKFNLKRSLLQKRD